MMGLRPGSIAAPVTWDQHSGDDLSPICEKYSPGSLNPVLYCTLLQVTGETAETKENFNLLESRVLSFGGTCFFAYASHFALPISHH